MRIIGGTFKGRRFHPPADNWPTRPTTDFAKEGLFNILQNRISFDETRMLDLFGGTGSHCYEFISRGCEDATYVDKFAGCLAFVKKTAAVLKIESYLTVVRSDVFKFIKRHHYSPYNYIFAGPPYGMPRLDDLPDLIFEHQLLDQAGLFVLEHNPNHEFAGHSYCTSIRSYGKTIFSFFEHKS